MKLTFKKDGNSEITVFINQNGKEKEFSYIEMIKDIIQTNTVGEPDVSGEFTEAEIASIKSMVKHINEEIAKYNEAAH